MAGHVSAQRARLQLRRGDKTSSEVSGLRAAVQLHRARPAPTLHTALDTGGLRGTDVDGENVKICLKLSLSGSHMHSYMKNVILFDPLMYWRVEGIQGATQYNTPFWRFSRLYLFTWYHVLMLAKAKRGLTGWPHSRQQSKVKPPPQQSEHCTEWTLDTWKPTQAEIP